MSVEVPSSVICYKLLAPRRSYRAETIRSLLENAMMSLPLALLTVLTLGASDSGALSLTNVRLTHGLLGPTRTEAKFLPGDSLFLVYDINGIQRGEDGKVHYSVGVEVTDRQGKVIYKREPQEREAVLLLGGHSLPGFANLNIGLDQPPAEYTLRVTVTDHANNASQTLSRDVEVLPKDFGLVRLKTTADPEGILPAPFVGEGQALYVNFTTVGFARDTNTQEARLCATLRVLDENGKPTTSKPLMGECGKEIPKKSADVPMNFLLPLNRAGKFTVELEVADQVANKTAKLSFPLTVLKAS
jgi:hypothetical protein